jgi:hypothetical protein
LRSTPRICSASFPPSEPSDYDLESIETQSTTILITAFAMVQARTAGLTNFHATIVLDLELFAELRARIIFF